MSRLDFGYGLAREDGQVVALVTLDYEDEEQTFGIILDVDEAEGLITSLRDTIDKSRAQREDFLRKNAS